MMMMFIINITMNVTVEDDDDDDAAADDDDDADDADDDDDDGYNAAQSHHDGFNYRIVCPIQLFIASYYYTSRIV